MHLHIIAARANSPGVVEVGITEGRAERAATPPAPSVPFASTGPHGHRQRMRERLLARGPGALADYEVLEMLLFLSIPRRDTKPLAKAAINRFGSLRAVLLASADEIGTMLVDLLLVRAVGRPHDPPELTAELMLTLLFGALRPVVPIDALGPDGIPASLLTPDLPLKRFMAGGTKTRYFRPIRPGDVLVATRSLTDLQEKRGSQGDLIFLTYKVDVRTEGGERIAEEVQTRIAR